MSQFDERGVTNKFLEDFLLHVCDPSFYGGVFASDEFSMKMLEGEKRKGWIINLNPRRIKEGGHFICLIQDFDQLIYIDPVGIPCMTATLRKIFKQSGKKLYFNCSQIQNPTSNTCGIFSVLFLVYFSRPERSFNMKFDTQQNKKNDKLCFYYLKKLVDIDKIKLVHILENIM